MIMASRRALRELISNRRELAAMVRYNLSKSYSGDRLGAVWWFLEPIIYAAVFYFVMVVVFSRGGPEYFFNLISGLFAWQIFANTVNATAGSLLGSGGLLKQGAIRPMTALSVPFFTGILRGSTAILLVLPFTPYGFGPTLPLVAVAIILQAGLAAAIGIPLAALVAIVPDVRRLLGFVTRIGWFLTPVLYPLSNILEGSLPAWAKTLYMSNPVVYTISLFRYAFEGRSPLDVQVFVLTGALIVVAVFIGLGVAWRSQNIAMKYI